MAHNGLESLFRSESVLVLNAVHPVVWHSRSCLPKIRYPPRPCTLRLLCAPTSLPCAELVPTATLMLTNMHAACTEHWAILF